MGWNTLDRWSWKLAPSILPAAVLSVATCNPVMLYSLLVDTGNSETSPSVTIDTALDNVGLKVT